MLKQIAFESPDRPSRVEKTIPRDLETIIVKALQKDADDRYATAQDLADDLKRFIENRPILAKKVGVVDWAGKWVRRHQTLAFTSAALLLVAFCLSIVGYANASRTAEARRRQAYLGDMSYAYKGWFEGHVKPTKQILDAWAPSTDNDIHGFEYYHLQHRRQLDDAAPRFEFDAPVNCVVYSPSGSDLAVHLKNGKVFGVNVATGIQRQLADFGAESMPGHPNSSGTLQFSPDGSMLYVGGNFADQGAVCRVQLESLDKTFFRSGAAAAAPAIALSPDGEWVVAGQWLGEHPPKLWVWRTDTPDEPDCVLYVDQGQISSVSFSPDGGSLFCTTRGGRLLKWNWQSKQSEPEEHRVHRFATSSADIATSGELAASSGFQYAIWETAGMTMKNLLPASPGMQVRFSPSGHYVASVHNSGQVILWDAKKGGMVNQFHHELPTLTLCFSPDGRNLASGGVDKTVRIWDIERTKPFYSCVEHANSLSAHNGVVALTYVDDKPGPFDLVLWDAADNQVQSSFPLVDVPYEVRSVQLHPDHNAVATISGRGGGEVWLWDVATGERTRVLDGAWFACGFLHDGDALVSVGPDGLALWDWRSGRAIFREELDSSGFLYGQNCELALSPDGRFVAFGTGALRKHGDLHVWSLDVANPRQMFQSQHADLVESVTISPDNRFIAAADASGITVWNVAKRDARKAEDREEFFIQGTEIVSVAYSPDQKTLVAGSKTGIRFYHAKTGREVGHVPLHESIDGVCFADENTLAYVSLFGAGALRTSRSNRRK